MYRCTPNCNQEYGAKMAIPAFPPTWFGSQLRKELTTFFPSCTFLQRCPSCSFLFLTPWLPCFPQTTRHSWNQGQAAGPAHLPLFWLIVISPSCVFNILINSLFCKQVKPSFLFIHSFCFVSFSCEFIPCVIMLDHV